MREKVSAMMEAQYRCSVSSISNLPCCSVKVPGSQTGSVKRWRAGKFMYYRANLILYISSKNVYSNHGLHSLS